jgi:UDP-glucose 4-epimerase
LIQLKESNFKNSEVFNGGTGKTIDINTLAQLIIRLTNSNSKIIYTSPRSWDHVKHRRSDIKKSSNLLGYNPINDFEENLKVTIEWIKQKI